MTKQRTEEETIDAALGALSRTIIFLQETLQIYPDIKVVLVYGNSIETLEYTWDGERFTA